MQNSHVTPAMHEQAAATMEQLLGESQERVGVS